MQSISKHRFQNLSSVKDFRSWFWSKTPNDIPFDLSKRLIVKTSWLSDNEIKFGNNLPMAKFDKIGLYHITSLQFQCLKNQSLVELFNNEYAVIDSKKQKKMLHPKIYDLFSQDFSDKYTKGDAVTISDNYVEWKHDCDSLPKLLNKGSEHLMVTMNTNLLQNH